MTRILTALALGTLVLAPAASAQMRPEVSVGYDANLSAPSIGFGVRSPMGSLPLTFAPHGDYYITDKGTALQGNVDGLYTLPGNTANIYLGAGLAIGYEKGKNNADNCSTSNNATNCTLDLDGKIRPGVNGLFGATFNGMGLRPYLQLRVTANTASSAGISAGLIF